MLNTKAFANAATVVMAVFYVICAVLSYLAPDLIFSISRSWMHTINIESIKSTFTPDVGTLAWGLLSLAVVTWITTYGTIWLYNRLAKKG